MLPASPQSQRSAQQATRPPNPSPSVVSSSDAGEREERRAALLQEGYWDSFDSPDEEDAGPGAPQTAHLDASLKVRSPFSPVRVRGPANGCFTTYRPQDYPRDLRTRVSRLHPPALSPLLHLPRRNIASLPAPLPFSTLRERLHLTTAYHTRPTTPAYQVRVPPTMRLSSSRQNAGHPLARPSLPRRLS